MANEVFLYPNVTSIPSQPGIGSADKLTRTKDGAQKGDFDQVLDKAFHQPGEAQNTPDLSKVRQPLKFSAHATQRLQDRKITIDQPTMAKVNDAIDRAAAKGIEDTLVITPDAALIVSVKNRTVITALEKGAMSGNVFTNIDGAVII